MIYRLKIALAAFVYRLKIALAAFVMLVLFLLLIVPGVCIVPFLLVAWVLNGNDRLQEWVTSFGQALDAAAGVVLHWGHPKETISSWAGRCYETKYGNAYDGRPPTIPDLVIPWQAAFVKWLTDLAEDDHVYKSVEAWAIEKGVPL